MPLEFQPYEDVRLNKSPLTEVVCQVRFDPILRIANEAPARFQELVRQRFPKFMHEQPISIQIPDPNNPSSTVSVTVTPTVSRFLTPDGNTSVSLTQDFFALSTGKYSVWEDFADDLALVSEAVDTCYGPLSTVRIGLRYVNELRPRKLGLADLDEMLEVLNPSLITLLRDQPWTDVRAYHSQIELDDDGPVLVIRLGLKRDGENPSVALDLDYFQEGTLEGTEGLVERCERFHNAIYRAFR